MAYCRFSDGDVYLYEDVRGGITCCDCYLGPDVFGMSRAEAVSMCCGKPVGVIEANVSTVFGLDEDERVLVHGRARVYA